MEFELSTHNFSVAPGYFALSYAWGTEEDQMPISVGNRSFKVTKNLHLVLSCLSPWLRNQTTHSIWIDAICIDQGNDAEQFEQIQNMCNVYRQAKQVIAFPGAPSRFSGASHTEPIFSRICLVLIQLEDIMIKTHVKNGSDAIPLLYSDPDRFPYTLKPSHKELMWKFLFELFQSPWWKRAWVVQEVYCSQKLTIVFGGIGFSLKPSNY
jgi:hypothetical protein